MLHIGCHLSSAKGYAHMGKEALSIGADTFQFFTRNPRGGKAKPVDEEDYEALRRILVENHFAKIIAHAPYTLNACAADEGLRTFARETMKDDLMRLEYLPDLCYYNFHPGSHVKQGSEAGVEKIIEVLNDVLRPEQHTTVLLETMAGKGSEVGRCFEELHRIIEGVELKDHLGVCMDTCHVWDGGYDIAGNLEGVLEEFDRVVGIGRLKAMHLNDSMNPLGAHKDRHAKIGEGYIGAAALSAVTRHPQLRDLPFCLETPNDLKGYGEEIRLLRAMWQD